MRIVTILGSPKADGKTAQALDLLEKNLALRGHDVQRIHIIDYKINGCVACNACITEKQEPNCVQKDDAASCFSMMMSADTLVYAFPLYAFGFPAQIKPLIDRHYCFVTNAGSPDQSSVVAGKRAALLVTCSYPAENNADVIQVTFDRMCDLLKCILVGKYIIESSGAPDFDQRAERTSEILAQAICSAE